MLKKMAGFVFIFSCILLSFSTSVFASTDTEVTEDVYKKAVELNLIQLQKDGTVQFAVEQEEVKIINNDFYNELSEIVNSINYLVENKFGSVNENLEFEFLSPEEITEVVFQAGNNQSLTDFELYAIDPGLPNLALNSLVLENRNELENFYNIAYKVDRTQAYSATVGFFVGKVQERGPWDYKTQPGFFPWYKQFNASMFGGAKKVITSEYIGNYNYAFTGQFLFTKNTLLIGGQAIGGNIFKPESEEDRAAIILGFDHAVQYR